MSGIIDCAVLLHPAREGWLDEWMTRSAGAGPRLRLHAYELARASEGLPSVDALRDVSLQLRRYDVAILPVSYASLSWARTALAGVGHPHALPIPLLALVEGLRAPAIQDLFQLGVADFLREDDSLDDLRLRLTQMACAQGPAAQAGWERAGGEADGAGRFNAGKIYAPTPLAAPLCQEPSVDAAAQDAWPDDDDETFRMAKTRVVARFERDYIARALSRHAGNISMAARSAQKHRRAFWALMRKHRIDADLYRQPVCSVGDDLPAPD